MKINTWTSDEINFLTDNFSIYGMKYCSDKLKYKNSKISAMTHKLGLKINKDKKIKYCGKSNETCNINPDLFYNITTKETSYILGLLWADGFLNKSGRSYNLGVGMIKNDILTLKSIFDNVGKWNFYETKGQKITWNDQIRVVTNNKRIFDFLIENDYHLKSHSSANKILNKIPGKLHQYFFRGLIDGDGCFYYKKNGKSTMRQFTISSTYNQDWEYVSLLFEILKIKYSINRIIRKKSSYSQIRITNKQGIKYLGEYVYNDFDNEKIGLLRKYEKYCEIIN
jgi:hypothetical protein